MIRRGFRGEAAVDPEVGVCIKETPYSLLVDGTTEWVLRLSLLHDVKVNASWWMREGKWWSVKCGKEQETSVCVNLVIVACPNHLS